MFTLTARRHAFFFLFLLLFLFVNPDGGQAETAVIPIQYRRAAEALPIISHFLSQNGVVMVDERTNTLIVVDIADSITKINDFEMMW